MVLPDNFYSEVLERIPQFVGVAEPADHHISWINKPGLKLFNFEAREIKRGIKLNSLFANVPIELDSFRKNLKSGSPDAFTGTYEFVTRKQHTFFGLFKYETLSLNGQFLHLITITKLAGLTEQKNETEKENERFKVLFENSTVGILVADAGGTIVTLNRFAENQFGYSRGELIGNQVETLIPEDIRSKHVALRENFMHEPQHRPMGIGLYLNGRKKDGSTFPVEISLSYYNMNGQVFVIAFINDITIRKQAEETILRQKAAAEKYSAEVKRLNEALERRVQERTTVLRETLHQLEKSKVELEDALEKEKELSDLKSRFVSMASHEFRTPLSTILSSASLIERYQAEAENEKIPRHIHRIKENVKNLNDILEDFLSLGKLEEGLISPRIEALNIPEFISSIIHDINEVKKDHQTVIYQNKGKDYFPSDKHLLKNILINLLSNAVKFSGEEGRIEVSSEISDETLKLSVRDHGIGISEDDQQHLFDRFFRGKNALNIKGTGLGLHIVSKYLELLNGAIHVESHLNEGTEFTLVFQPLKDEL